MIPEQSKYLCQSPPKSSDTTGGHKSSLLKILLVGGEPLCTKLLQDVVQDAIHAAVLERMLVLEAGQQVSKEPGPFLWIVHTGHLG